MRSFALPASARNRAWLCYLLAGSALTALYLFAPPVAGNGPLINALGLSGVVAIVVGIRMHRPRARAAWWLTPVAFLFAQYSHGLNTFFFQDDFKVSSRVI